MPRPDYATLRQDTKFRWSVGSTYLALLELTGIPIRDFNLDPVAGIELYRKGRPLLRDMFGPDVLLPEPATPPISYGHINSLGIGLVFPEGGEVNYEHAHGSLADAMTLAVREVDFAASGMAPFYLEYRARLQEAFPGENVDFSYKAEGPLTTAYTLRGMDVFLDPYDDPKSFKELLSRLVDSIITFDRFLARIRNTSLFNADGAGLCDDVAAMFSPDMWPDFVLPYWEKHYRARTSGRRSVHVEDLRPEHLRFLETIGLAYYDPSISPKLNPRIIGEKCRVPFGWRLANFHYPGLSVQEVKDFVFQAAADGACHVFTYACAAMCNDETVAKVHAFMEAAKTAEALLAGGASRADIGELVSPEGRRKFWDRWPDRQAVETGEATATG